MLTFNAPAKINWFLNVRGLRKDGFHEIRSLIQKVSLFDTLTFRASDTLVLRTEAPIPQNENLVYKAAACLRRKYSVEKGAEIALNKRIPSGAGLGGGSSDAAITLLALNKLWSLELSIHDLCRAGEEIGSDVPFFLYDSLCYVEGRGEKLSRLTARRPLALLLVKPAFAVSTKWVYNNIMSPEYTRTRNESDPPELTKNHLNDNNIKHFIRSIKEANLSDIAQSSRSVSNDLESVTLKSFPIVGEIKEHLIRQGALFSRMSGSGPTVFGVFASYQEAINASKMLDAFWTAPVLTLTDSGDV